MPTHQNARGETVSDTIRPRLLVDKHYRTRSAVRALYEKVRRHAGQEGKIPVITLVDMNRPGSMVCVHSDDLAAFVLGTVLPGRRREVGVHVLRISPWAY